MIYELDKKPKIYSFKERPFEAHIVAVPKLFTNLSGSLNPVVFPANSSHYDDLRIEAATKYFETIKTYFDLCKKAADEAYGYITEDVRTNNHLCLDHFDEIGHPETPHLMHINYESTHLPTPKKPFEKIGYLVDAHFPEFDNHVNRHAVSETRLLLLTNRSELEKLIVMPLRAG